MLLAPTLVVDATDQFGWLAGRVLADLGADVVKLDAPGTDQSRPQWRAFNVNKRVLDLDPCRPADQPQLEARGFFQTINGEHHCGGFALIDGERPPLRHAAGTPEPVLRPAGRRS